MQMHLGVLEELIIHGLRNDRTVFVIHWPTKMMTVGLGTKNEKNR